MSALAKALERIDELCTPEDWLIAATCRGLIRGYHYRWHEEQRQIELLECEACYTAPLTNIETGRTSRTYTTAGVLDKVVIENGQKKLFDHKTTASDISDPASAYWRQLVVDSQGAHYELILLANEIQLDGITWDVTRKPGIRPKQITRRELAAAKEDANYCGFDISNDTLAWLHEGNDRENGELYEYRVADESIKEPERYFARRQNPRTREQLAEYAQELWGTAKAIREAELQKQHFRNPGACFNFGTPCEFLSLCSGSDTPDSDRWQKKPAKHPELPEGIGGHSVLTNSRLRTFATCRRKHFYQYELGIERFDAERREALYFGKVWHETLDVWWRAQDEERKHGCSNEQSSPRDDSRQAEAELAG